MSIIWAPLCALPPVRIVKVLDGKESTADGC
nr:MAG TPA: hypothetical protein [Caudoviricetes sp.]